MKFSLLINMKMPTVVSYVSTKDFANIDNLRFISRKKIMVSCVEHEKRFITLGPDFHLNHGVKVKVEISKQATNKFVPSHRSGRELNAHF